MANRWEEAGHIFRERASPIRVFRGLLSLDIKDLSFVVLQFQTQSCLHLKNMKPKDYQKNKKQLDKET